MSEYDEILDELSSLERKVDTLTSTFVACTTDIVEAIKINTDIAQQLGEAMALARSPSTEDLEKSATLREAYDRYDFIRKLALGEENKNE